MKLMTSMFALISLLTASAAFAGSSTSVGTGFGNTTVEQTGGKVKVTIGGAAAETIYESLTSAEARGPFATGLCMPNRPCDPPTFWGRSGPGVECAKTTYSASGRVTYSCVLTIAADGSVAAN